ncbi:Decaprenyl diphosphate synthase-like protein [Phellopilus nigrolimitatus]|nr:Decaprenyl diphosphate synthase-like protein [Phellopilus nigrolimitatus]
MFPLFSFLLWLFALLKSRTERIALNILSAGPIPRHVAFIMDGNRRYARGKHIEVANGHVDGFQTLRRLLEVCLNLNIKCVSVYAFAIENFKRPPEEVDALMKLARDKLHELCEKGNLLDEYGVRLCVLGRTSMLPVDVQEAVQKAENMTRHNDRAILNLCMPYASRDEIATAVQRTVDKTLSDDSDISAITEASIDANLMTTLSGSPPLDILVRTSGVRRLSDYMLWQCAEDTQIQFVPCYWPDFGMREFIPIILAYQRKFWARRAAKDLIDKKK